MICSCGLPHMKESGRNFSFILAWQVCGEAGIKTRQYPEWFPEELHVLRFFHVKRESGRNYFSSVRMTAGLQGNRYINQAVSGIVSGRITYNSGFLSDSRTHEAILLMYTVRPSAVSCIRSGKRLPEFPDHPSPYRCHFPVCRMEASGTDMEIRAGMCIFCRKQPGRPGNIQSSAS